jgi:hypothetical protein
MRRLFPEFQSRTYKSSVLSDPSQDSRAPGISLRALSFQYPSAPGRDYYGNKNYIRLHHRTENYIRLHHHLGDCYLINIDETLVYAD